MGQQASASEWNSYQQVIERRQEQASCTSSLARRSILFRFTLCRRLEYKGRVQSMKCPVMTPAANLDGSYPWDRIDMDSIE